MKPLLFLLSSSLFFFFNNSATGQKITDSVNRNLQLSIQQETPATPPPSASEICGNSIDDDGNGLADMKDFSCFFNTVSPDTCLSTKVVWGIYGFRLYWQDMETNTYRFMSLPQYDLFFDITWTPDGKLYGIEGFSDTLKQINPYTGKTQFKAVITNYTGFNAMTSDATGNLYLVTANTPGTGDVIKYNMGTGQVTHIMSMSSNGLVSAGDCTFLNGFLYVTCTGNKLLKVNVHNHTFQVYDLLVGMDYPGFGFGITTLGDGYLYTSGINKLFRIDASTMIVTPYYTFPTANEMTGLTSYSEFCNAPGCRSKLDINIETSPPYCSDPGVLLKGIGSGISVTNEYTWTLPDGQQKTEESLIAKQSGTYKLRYHTVPDTCGTEKTININITPFPAASLGNDTLLCPGVTHLLLQVRDTAGVADYLWQDGSNGKQFTVTHPGIYWLQSSNTCGYYIDSIVVLAGNKPDVNLGQNVLVCPGASTVLSNQGIKQPGNIYRWSDNSTADSIIISRTGSYWLQATNLCGSATDTILVLLKDSCICNPFQPEIDLGEDQELCENKTLRLFNTKNKSGFRYTWQDGSHGNEYLVTEPGIYWVTVSTYCGSVSDTVIVKRKTEDCVCAVYMPTAFSPDQNGANDFYKPGCNCLITGEMRIYNRWGELLYQTTDLKQGWDGKHHGKLQPSGAYVCQISYRVPNKNISFNKRGTFLLIR